MKYHPQHTMQDGSLNSTNNSPHKQQTKHWWMNLAAGNYWLKLTKVGRRVMVYSSPDAQTGSGGSRPKKTLLE